MTTSAAIRLPEPWGELRSSRGAREDGASSSPTALSRSSNSTIPAPSGATYIIRRDVIEITTGTFAGAEKTVRVYPVADLVTPIPNAVNFTLLQGAATIFGLSAGALGGFAGIGVLLAA